VAVRESDGLRARRRKMSAVAGVAEEAREERLRAWSGKHRRVFGIARLSDQTAREVVACSRGGAEGRSLAIDIAGSKLLV
jgi:hypothetical protein